MNSLLFLVHIGLLLFHPNVTLLSQFKLGIRTEVLYNLLTFGALNVIFFSEYTVIESSLPSIFYVIYFSVFLPYIINFPIRTLQLFF